MKLVRAKLIAAREELIIRQRELAAAQRNYNRVLETLKDLEVRIESHLEGLKRSSEDAGRAESAGDAEPRESD
jgi:flagellar motility protein MotE (MotC chaperone)